MSSEITRIRQQIATEYDAAKNGLEGLAQGISRHDFISSKMERIGTLHHELEHIIGPLRALEIVNQAMMGGYDVGASGHPHKSE